MKQTFTISTIVLTICAFHLRAQSQPMIKLKFVNEFVVPFNQDFRGTTIGGLSGIDYDRGRDVFYILSDDRSDINPARFYTTQIRITEKGIDSVIFTDVHSLLQSDGKIIPASNYIPKNLSTPKTYALIREQMNCIGRVKAKEF